MTIAIFGNLLKPETEKEVEHLIDLLQRRNAHIVLSEELRQVPRFRTFPQFPESSETIEFAISIGGDGTFLTTAAAIGNRDIPILGINFGHLGFLAEVKAENEDYIMDQLLEGHYTIEQRALLHLTCSSEGRLSSPYALNEIAVMKYGLSSMIVIETKINGEHLHNYEADGLILATPTGSTAYNMSVGGPLMVPQARGILLSPIASHSLNIRPLVIPDDWEIDLKIKSRTGAYMISVDGRSQILSEEVLLHIQRAKHTIKLVQIEGNSFIQSLKNKLSWGI